MSFLPVSHIQDEKERVRLAARFCTSVEELGRLAADVSLTVRAAVALNPACGPSIEALLAGDTDARVRGVLAGRLARLLPGLATDDQDVAARHVRDTLAILAADAAEHVRVVVAQVVHAMPEAPRALVLALARDAAASVSVPVLRYSPLLTDGDLLELLATPSHAGAGVSIAARAGLSEAMVEHIAAHADSTTIAALLANESVAIREATLDALIGRAADQPSWHEVLVRRPSLHSRAAVALSQIVAGQLLAQLAARTDLPTDALDAIRTRLEQALAPAVATSDEELLAFAERSEEAGTLGEEAILEAARAGETRLVAAMLAVASGVTMVTIDRMVRRGSAKGLVSLAWKAGLSMSTASIIQGLLGRLSPEERLEPNVDAGFPMTQAEMEWQVELLSEPAG